MKMAIWKYRTQNGVRWTADLYRDGVRIGRKSGFTTKREAKAWEMEMLTSGPKPIGSALCDVCTRYILYCEKRLKPNTVSYKKTVYRHLIDYLGPDCSFRDISQSQINSFIESVADSISSKSANKYKVILSSLWSWAQKEGECSGNPVQQVDSFPVQKTERYVPPSADVRAVLNVAEDGFEKDFLLCLLHTAGRISEIRNLTWRDVNLEHRYVVLWTCKRRGGNMEPRKIAMSKTLHAVLSRRFQQRYPEDTHVFTNPETHAPYTRGSNIIKFFMDRLCRRAAVPPFTAHALRHFVATDFDDARRAQRILGHKSIRTTEIYLHELQVDRSAAEKFEDITKNLLKARPVQETVVYQ